jgi:hypothetical protein
VGVNTAPQQYYVEWRIDVWASSPEEAARLAHEIQQDPDSLATTFHVATPDGFTVVDVAYGDEEDEDGDDA